MDFRLLGPFEVESDGRDVTPARRKQRLLLVALLLRPNQVVATDDLIEALWGASPPASAQKALQGHVSALRRLLGPAAIETRPPGYLLQADVGSIDARRFETLVDAARREADARMRTDLLCSALGLFRGEPLADFRYEPFALEEAARLEELRLGAVTDRVGADLELGRHGDVIPELERLVAEHPHEEGLRAALMLALYRAGRQAQALQTYSEGRRRLVEDLGIEPGPALQRLEHQILNQDPALELEAARASSAPRTNLPRQPTPLIGRERQLADVRARLRGGDGRLWTLTGPAGTGKTRLAIEAAAGVVEDFPDGTFFVALAPIADPDLVLPTVADTIGVDKGSGLNVADVFAQGVVDKKLLLVLDNFEHVLASAPVVSQVVAGTNEITVLATSRERLRVGGEHVYPVPPLSSDEGMLLFAERAQAVNPDFRLTELNERAVAEICRRLDGLPLAIELAAARVALFPPAALLERLDERLKLLTGGGRDRPERHQTLRAAIDWSHDLLSAEDQSLLSRLSVFAGGWTLEAAEGVCAGELDVIEGLSSLVDKSLVRLEGTEDEPRFAMLETIREYARERLQAAGDDETRRRHAEYFLAFAEGLEPVLVGRNGREAQRQLLAELDNFRAALTWATEKRSGVLALRLISALWRFWWDHSLGAESQAWCDAALAAAPDAPPEIRGRALFAAGDALYALGDWIEYRRVLVEAIPLLEAGGDEEFLLYAMWGLAVVDQLEGRYDVSDRRARDALERAEAADYGELVGRLNTLLGYGAQMRGDAVEARVYFDRAAAKHTEIGDAYGRAVALENLAAAAVLTHDPETAAHALAECLDEWDFSQNVHNLGHVLVVAAAVARSYGEATVATRLLGLVAAQFERVGVVLQPVEADLDRETREFAEAELGPARYEEELRRGAAQEPGDELPVVRAALRRWLSPATSPASGW